MSVSRLNIDSKSLDNGPGIKSCLHQGREGGFQDGKEPPPIAYSPYNQWLPTERNKRKKNSLPYFFKVKNFIKEGEGMQAMYKETYKLESTDTSFGVPYPCRTLDTPRTLLHLCPNCILLNTRMTLIYYFFLVLILNTYQVIFYLIF